MQRKFVEKWAEPVQNTGITAYGCAQDEIEMFREISPGLGVTPTIVERPVSSRGGIVKNGNRCISVDHKTKVCEATLLALRTAGVRYISTRSVGVNHIDARAAKRLGITIGNVTYAPDGVADYTVMLLLMALRDVKTTLARSERFDFRLPAVRGQDLSELTVGVVGAGRIGRAVMQRLSGFGCRVLAHGHGGRAGLISLQALLAQSDVVTLHTPLTTDTVHMLGRKEMESMKTGALLINTGRGALVDTAALVKALETGKLGGAALDVLEGEEGLFYADCSQRPMHHPYLARLQSMSNVLITPHTAYYTRRTLHETIEKTILNCLDFERGLHHAEEESRTPVWRLLGRA